MKSHPQVAAFSGDETTIRVVGHRGARGILPENSIVGFDFALSIGVDLLEFDVLLTRDAIPVITHNHEFHGSAVRGPDGAFLNGEHPRVASLTIAEIERFDIGRLNGETEYGQRFPDQAQMDGVRVPRLSELLHLVSQPKYEDACLMLELKSDPDLARDGEEFELAARPMTVYRLEMLNYAPDAASFEVEATKGFYVRALARDLALACGTLGHVTSLRRLATGPFEESQAVSLEKLEDLGQDSDLFEYLADPIHALAGIPAVELDPTEAVRMRNGNPVSLVRRSQIGRLGDVGLDDEVVVTVQGQLLALARFEAGQLQPIRVFNL